MNCHDVTETLDFVRERIRDVEIKRAAYRAEALSVRELILKFGRGLAEEGRSIDERRELMELYQRLCADHIDPSHPFLATLAAHCREQDATESNDSGDTQ